MISMSESASAESSTMGTSRSDTLSFVASMGCGAPVGVVGAEFVASLVVGPVRMVCGLQEAELVGTAPETGPLAIRGAASMTISLRRGNSDRYAASSCEEEK